MSFRPLLTIDYSTGLAGDFDNDGQYTPADLDMLCAAIDIGGPNDPYDVDGDNDVDADDMRHEVENIIGTHFGDTDVDIDVDLSDLGNLATNYEQAPPRTWAQGDTDCDGDVDLSDLGNLATNYGLGQAQAMSDFYELTGVPEPSGLAVLLIGGLPLVRRRCSKRG